MPRQRRRRRSGIRVEVGGVGRVEEVPAGERHHPVDDVELRHLAPGRRRHGVDERDAVGARRRSAPDDVAPAAVADETHGTLVPVDLRGHRRDPVIHGDVGRLGGGSADAGKGERDGRMARLAERGEHGIPRRRRQPEPGNENDFHGPTVVRAPDTEKTPVTGEPPGTETPTMRAGGSDPVRAAGG